MSDLGLIQAELNGLPTELKPIFLRIFQSILRDTRFGHPTGNTLDPSQNFGGGFVATVTPATPGDLFTIPHAFGRTPYLALPVLTLDVAGAQIVPLTVEQVADDKRIYLSSTVALAPVTIFVEG